MCEEQKKIFDNSQYKKMLAKPPVQLKTILLKQLDLLHMNQSYNKKTQKNKNSNNSQIPFKNIYDYYLEYLNRKDLIENNLSLHYNNVSRQQIMGVIDKISHVELCKLISNENIKKEYMKNFLDPTVSSPVSSFKTLSESVVVEYTPNNKNLPSVIKPLSISILPPLPPPLLLPLPMKKIPIFSLNPTFDNLKLSPLSPLLSFKTTPHFNLPVLTQKNMLSTKYPLSLISYPVTDTNLNNLEKSNTNYSNTNYLSNLYSISSNTNTDSINQVYAINLKETLPVDDDTEIENDNNTEIENDNNTEIENNNDIEIENNIVNEPLDKENELIEDYLMSDELKSSIKEIDNKEIDKKIKPLTEPSKYVNYCLIV